MSSKNKKNTVSDKKERRRNRWLVTELIAIFAAICVIFFWGSGVWKDFFPAIRINGSGYRLADFNYFYYAYYNSFVQENSDMVSYMFDEGKSLKEQTYDNKTGETWFEYFVDSAADSMKEITAIANVAEDDNYQLSDSLQVEIKNQMEALDSFSENLGKTTDNYLQETYGKDMTREKYLKYLTLSKITEGYIFQKKTSYTLTEDQIEKKYKDEIKDYTTVSYERFYVKAANINKTVTEEERAAAKQIADEILRKVEEGTDLITVSEDYTSFGTYHSFDDAEFEEQSSYGDWLFDDEREDGDATVIDDGNGYYVIIFHARNNNTYLTANILDMFFPLDESLDSLDEQLEKSCEEAEDKFHEWQQGGASEGLFQKLAESQSEKSRSDDQYFDMKKDTMDSFIEKWVFSEDRQPGDCKVLYSPSGFHLIYYQGHGKEAWKVMVLNDYQEQQYQEWYRTLMNQTVVKKYNLVLKHAAGY